MQWTTEGIAVRHAAGQLRSLSVISRRGTQPCRFSNFRKNRSAARRFRRDWDEDVEHVAVLVHSPPEILLATVECDEQFVEVSRVTP